ncbi:MAG: InlB B-repeat-containing protein [Clostridia bacterium]|nr:InlB B-repeat-containing protein [Clostridia bacterium]
MIKKCSKILLTILFVFLISLITTNSVNAKEITLDELTDLVKDYNPNATYVYVIGDYAFTSGKQLTTQDVMLAARSIEVKDIDGETNKDDIYNEMTIAYYEGVFDSNWNLTGFKFIENIVGTTEPTSTLDIKYIDYNLDAAKLKVDVDTLVNEAYNTIIGQNAEDFEFSKDGNKINVILKDTEMNSIEALMGTGVATAAANFLKEEGVAGVTLKIGDVSLPITGDTVDKTAVENFFKQLGSKAGDLVDKTMTVTVAFEDGYKTANSTEFTVTFGKVVDVNALVEKAYNTIKNQAATDKFIVSLNGNLIEVKLMDTEMNSLEAMAGTGVATAINNFFDESGIASVTLEIDGNPLTVTKDPDAESVNEAEIEAFLKSIGNKAGDLIGKPITATVTIKEGFEPLNESNTFGIEFKDADKVDVDAIVSTAFNTVKDQVDTNIFEVTMNGSNIAVLIKDTSMNSIEAIAGTGVATAATNFLKEEGVAGVTLKIGDVSLPITGDTVDKTTVENFFKELGSTAADLVDKTMTVTVSFDEGYKTANSTEFTVTFGKLVDVNTLVNNAYETIKGQAATDKFVVGLNGTNVTVKLMDTEMNSIEAIAGTGVATAINNFFDESGIASVILEIDGNPLTITKDPDAESVNEDEIEAFLKTIGNKAGDLIGKPMTATVKFKDGFKTANSDKFTINFLEATPVDVSSLVNDAYTTIIDRAATEDFEITMDGTSIEVFLKDFEMTSVNALDGSGVGKAATDFLKEEGIAGVTLTLGEAKVELGSTPIDISAVEDFFKELGSKSKDLIGKTITATISFEEGYKKVDTDTFYITFSPKKYDVKFNVDGTELTNELVVIGETATKPTDPTKEGYTFDKWLLNGVEFDFSTPVTESITLDASWKINTYKISFVSDDPAFGYTTISELTVEHGTEISISGDTLTIGSNTVKAVTATNTAQYTYTFTGWTDIVSPVTNAFTITANFTETLNKYTVTYVDSNKEILGTEEVDYGTKVSELNPPTPDGKVLDALLLDSYELAEDAEITEALTLEVTYNQEVKVTEVVNDSLEAASDLIDTTIFDVAPLEDDVATVDFKTEIAVIDEDNNIDWGKAAQMGDFLESVADLLESLASNEAYDTVVFEYQGKQLNITDLTYDDISFSGFLSKKPSAGEVARFMSKVAGYSGTDGEDIMYVSTEKLVNGTKDTPIDVIITLKEGYANSDTEEVVHYDLVFTDSI